MGWSYASCYVQYVDMCHIAIGIQLPMLLFVTIVVQSQEYNRVMQLISVDDQKNLQLLAESCLLEYQQQND